MCKLSLYLNFKVKSHVYILFFLNLTNILTALRHKEMGLPWSKKMGGKKKSLYYYQLQLLLLYHLAWMIQWVFERVCMTKSSCEVFKMKLSF